jgi:hypothetical protein
VASKIDDTLTAALYVLAAPDVPQEARDEALSVRFYGRRQLIKVELPHAMADRTAWEFSMREIAQSQKAVTVAGGA